MNAIRVAIDATPLLGLRTGVGEFTAGALAALAALPDLALSAYALTWRGRGRLADLVPVGVAVATRPMAARPLRVAWGRWDHPTIERWTGPVDAVHGTNFVVPPARGGEVTTVHDLAALRFPELCDRPSLAYPALLRRALRRGAWVHAVSQFTASEVVTELDADTGRVVVVPPGVPPAEAGSAPAGRQLAGADRYVLSLGTVEPRKDHPTLVRAFATVAARDREVALVIAGADGWGSAALDAALAGIRHADRVRRLGWVSPRQRADLLAGAAALAFPSLYEGFGFPPLEAMAAGVPVVATATGSLPEVLGDAAVLVPVGDAAALAEALTGVLDDEAERGRLVEAGAHRVTLYSWERCAAGLADLYRRAAGARA